MTVEEKAALFDKLQAALWDAALHGNPLASTVYAAIIRQLEIPGPNGEDPNDA